MMFSITTYVITAALVGFVFLYWLMGYYKAKSKRLSVQLENANVSNAQLQTEIKHVQIKQKIETDNTHLNGSELDERMREQGYLRDE